MPRFLVSFELSVLLLAVSILYASPLTSAQRVWLDKSNLQTIFFGDPVTIRYEGYSEYRQCVVEVVDVTTQQAQMTQFGFGLDASCRAGYYSFRMPTLVNVSQIFVRSKAVASDGTHYVMQATNNTVYNVQLSLARSVLQSPRKLHDFSKKEAYTDYSGEIYRRPAGAEVWVYQNPRIIGPSEFVEIDFVGVDEYERVVVQLVAYDSNGHDKILNMYTWGLKGYVTIRKILMPACQSAFLKLIYFDNDNPNIGPYYFTSQDSLTLEEDPQYTSNNQRLARTIEFRYERSLETGEHIEFRPSSSDPISRSRQAWRSYRMSKTQERRFNHRRSNETNSSSSSSSFYYED